jgi:hypothetical protein
MSNMDKRLVPLAEFCVGLVEVQGIIVAALVELGVARQSDFETRLRDLVKSQNWPVARENRARAATLLLDLLSATQPAGLAPQLHDATIWGAE